MGGWMSDQGVGKRVIGGCMPWPAIGCCVVLMLLELL